MRLHPQPRQRHDRRAPQKGSGPAPPRRGIATTLPGDAIGKSWNVVGGQERQRQARRFAGVERLQIDERELGQLVDERAVGLEELRARRADEQQRRAGSVPDEVRDELQRGLARPVQILDDHDCRAVVGDALEEAGQGGEVLLPACLARRKTDQRQEPVDEPLVYPVGGGRLPELALHCIRRITLIYSGVCADNIAQRPVGQALSVRRATRLTPVAERLGTRVDEAEELPHEARLPDARLPHDRANRGDPAATVLSSRPDKTASSTSRPIMGAASRHYSHAPSGHRMRRHPPLERPCLSLHACVRKALRT